MPFSKSETTHPAGALRLQVGDVWLGGSGRGGRLREGLAHVEDPHEPAQPDTPGEENRSDDHELMDDHQQGEVGFTFSRAHQGQGLACEAATCVLNYAFTKLELHRVIAITDCENERSVALLSRLGMRREGHFIQNIWFKGKWGDEYLYAVLREEWLQK